MRLRLVVSLLVVVALSGAAEAWAKTSVKVDWQPGRFTTVAGEFPGEVIDGYNLYVPNSYARSKKKSFPVLVFLQGGAGTGGPIEQILRGGLPKLIVDRHGEGTKIGKYLLETFIVIAPHMSDGPFRQRQWYLQSAAIEQILRDVEASLRVDSNRIYLTGLSRGGFGSWGIASRLPGRFAAMVPICGGFRGVEDLKPLVSLPTWTIHNTGDSVVTYDNTEKGVARLEKELGLTFLRNDAVLDVSGRDRKKRFIFTSPKSDSHNAWTRTYISPVVYEWMLQFRLEK